MMSGFLLGAAGMFATMFGTQPVLPDIASEFGISPARSGLTISVVLLAIAIGAWLWGPFADRFGARRSLRLASGLLVVPTLAVAVAPSFEALVVLRGLQGLCMPGLLTVGVPYVAEVFGPQLGGRAMGYYVAALVAGGLVGRLGVGLVAAVSDWRVGLGVLTVLPLAATVLMARTLPEAPIAPRSLGHLSAVARHLRNPRLLQATIAGSALYLAFVGTFSYIAFRLETAPHNLEPATISLVFGLWVAGAAGPAAGRLADRAAWRPVAGAGLVFALTGAGLSLAASLPLIVLGLGLLTLGMFGGVTAAQLGLSGSTSSNRGVASAIYFSSYYVAGAIGGFLPGIAWEEWGWPGVAAIVAPPLAAALVLLCVGRSRLGETTQLAREPILR